MITIRDMLKYRFKFSEVDASWNGKECNFELRWYSDKFGEDGNEYWFEIVLGQHFGLKKRGIQFCWLNWDLGGGRRFVHVPCISLIQDIDGLLTMMYGIGHPQIEPREDEIVEQRYDHNKDVFKKYELPSISPSSRLEELK